ncbi:MAG: hypothetical protein RLZZ360_904 [Candidatus Parcubacteria bacterium]|jgi:hypothetical protein
MLEYLDMPRARTTTTEEETLAPKKRAPRKRVVTVPDGEAPAPRAPRAPRKRAESAVETAPAEAIRSEPARRAPTPIREQRRAVSRSRRSLMWTLSTVLLLCGAGVTIGMSDNGQIDVVAVVNERNERINRGEVREGESTITVPVQSSDVRPNGGLTPADTPTPPPVPETPATTTATSSDTGATENSSEGTGDAVEGDSGTPGTPTPSELPAPTS